MGELDPIGNQFKRSFYPHTQMLAGRKSCHTELCSPVWSFCLDFAATEDIERQSKDTLHRNFHLQFSSLALLRQFDSRSGNTRIRPNRQRSNLFDSG
ncbi:hypothetical protein BaRGS_00023909 [Batillaria attramentaria]|uniref:Uncharacterized protein n=1 Tax=Batillaria attramentaria TaxID=370345 RepID=A0ABD0KD02_9CAEN